MLSTPMGNFQAAYGIVDNIYHSIKTTSSGHGALLQCDKMPDDHAAPAAGYRSTLSNF